MPPNNLTWTSSRVDRDQRWQMLGQRGAVVWMTGLSGSGKSTLAVALDAWLHAQKRVSFVLDGDNLRQGLCAGLSFSADDRSENIRRAGEAARLLANAGVIAVCSLISPFRAERAKVRSACETDGIPFIEVFINAPIEVCESRDPRGLYKKARSGLIHDFTGISSPYEAPEAPEINLHTDLHNIEHCLEQLCNGIADQTRLDPA